jgi:hypothetical protein
MLYHRDIYIPEGMRERIPLSFRVEYSKHSIDEAEKDRKRYGLKILNLRRNLSFRENDIIEVETDSNSNIIKVVFREIYNSELDLVYAISLIDFKVKTLWLQKSDDTHNSLKRGKYERNSL